MSVGSSTKAERKTSISSVKSREQLLELEAAYFAHEMNTMKARRTKIIATLCDTVCSVETIREFLQSGMNVIRVNMAYCSQKTLDIIMKNKSIVEKEQGVFIPIIMDLKGNTMRLGSLDIHGGEIQLKKGDEFRISTNKKVKGNEHIISCDCSDLGKLLKPGDKLLVDYGRNVLIVKKVEKEGETERALRDKYPNRYLHGLAKKLSIFKTASFGEIHLTSNSNDEDFSETSPKSRDSGTDDKDDKFDLDEADEHADEEKAKEKEGPHSETISNTPKGNEKISHRRRFEYAFRKKKKIEKEVIVCEAESDCIIQSSKPFFIHTDTHLKHHSQHKDVNGRSYSLHLEDELYPEEDVSCINVKDIKDLNIAMKLDIDAIAITGVRNKKDIEEAKFILGKSSHIRVITKIQNATALENFDDILKASDGIIISRNYLSLHIPVEKLFFKQKEMVEKCHQAGKPVTIVSQVLESMVQGMVPTSSEINDIANLILDGVDSLTLVTETTYGLHRKQSLETLSRLCYEIEYNQIISRQKLFNPQENLQQIPSSVSGMTDAGKGGNLMHVIPKIDPDRLPSISAIVAGCVIKAVYDLQASLIIAFTQTGSTVLKLSKLRSPCPILAVTMSEKVARQVSLLASVTAVKVTSMFGKEELLKKVIGIAKDKNWIKAGDFIVLAFGDVEGVAGTTNSLKIVKVE